MKKVMKIVVLVIACACMIYVSGCTYYRGGGHGGGWHRGR